MKHIACCSFGKDSIATILLAHEKNEPLDLILYAEVMFDEETSGENPDHIDFIYNKAIPKLKELGYPTKVLRHDKTMKDFFLRRLEHSKFPERNGKLAGFPLGRGCPIGKCKIEPMRKFLKGLDCIEYIGIAADEPIRLERMHKQSNKVSLLEKYNYTEKMAYELCKKYDLLSPIYKTGTRGGCWFCPNAKIRERAALASKHPELWCKLKKLYEEHKHEIYRTKLGWDDEFESLDRMINFHNSQLNLFGEE